MKKEGFLVVLIVFIIISLATIRALNEQNVSVIVVVGGPPSLLLLEPLNITYSNVFSIPLTFLFDGADSIWYNIDNGNNISIIGNITFSAVEGSHVLTLFANNSFGTTQTNASFDVNLSGLVAWPEGVYEPNASGLAGTHRFTFNILFNNLTANSGSIVSCGIAMSDGTILTLNKTISTNITNITIQLNYTLKQSDSVSKTAPWRVKNCTLAYNNSIIFTASKGPLNGTIYVHGNNWTRFSSVDDDAYRAGDCFLGIPKRYFNNSYYCDYAGDVAFSVTMSRGMNIEGECSDNIDNDGNGNADCSDIYCRGIVYSCIAHAFAGDPFGGTCQNGICTETKTVGGKSFTYSYTRYVRPDGTLKIRFEGSGYSTASPVSFALTDIKGFTANGKYNRTGYLALLNDVVTPTSYKTESPSGISGNIDMVMHVKLNPANYSAGSYEFSIYVRQYGEDLLIAGIPIVVSNDAPSNWNESESLAGIIDSPCSDSVDNDINYMQNCADKNCTGQIGGNDCTGGNAFCQANESTCYDCFDNDANSLTDCADPSCDLMQGNYQNTSNLCEYRGEGYGSANSTYNLIYPWPSACADLFNNDAENGVDCYDLTHCRGKGGASLTLPCPAYENNTASWCFDNADNDYDGKTDCADPDCRGVIYNGKKCPVNETLDSNGTYSPAQCFDGLDNDLDNFTDCADSNCWSIKNPANSTQICQAQEFNLTQHYQFCTDKFDNNANGLLDCSDLSCKAQFRVCGPCPSMENITWRSCADGSDNDYNGLTDCADPNCAGEIGSTDSGQRCGTENCSDNFDNDANGKTDCADASCNLKTGPHGEICQPAGETSCSDNLDNDADGLIDCIDSDCFGLSGCSSSWNTSSCISVPYTTDLSQISPTTISVSHLSRHYVNTNYTIEIKGTGSYNVVTITLGDATDSSKYFPYNAASCILNGTNKLKWVASQSEVGQIQHDPSQVNDTSPLKGFDVFLTCSSTGSPQTKSYPITIANLNNGFSETGETTLTAAVYENTAPTVSKIEIEPSDGNILYGESLKIRIVPNQDSSGICKCYLNASGTIYESSDGNCIITLSNIQSDFNYSFSARAKDGANNAGAWNATQSFLLKANPKSLTTSLNKNEPFYKGVNTAQFSATFIAADNRSFSSSCRLAIKNSTSSLFSMSVPNIGSGNSAVCNLSNLILPFVIPDNLYYMEMNITDSQGAVVKSDSKVFYLCNSLLSHGNGWTCAKADFDQDGATDGLYTTLYGSSQACDMCPNIANLNIDTNANGIDAACDSAENVIITPPGPPTPGPGQGGGKPPQPLEKDFRVTPDFMKIKLKPGESDERTLSIKNTGTLPLTITISSNLGNLFSVNNISSYSFALQPNEEMPLKVKFSAGEYQEPGVYTGYISVAGDGIQKTVTVSVEVESLKAKFGIDLLIADEFKILLPGESLTERIIIFNISQFKGENATITYTVKNSDNGIVFESAELVKLEEKTYFKIIALPSLPTGIYSSFALLKYKNMVAIDSDTFTVSLQKPAPKLPFPLSLAPASWVSFIINIFNKIKEFLLLLISIIKNFISSLF